MPSAGGSGGTAATGGEQMRAIAVFMQTIQDAEALADYRTKVIPTLEAFGGKFLVRGGHFTVIEGAMPHGRIVMAEFPSRAQAEAWYTSAAYQAILPLRLNSMDCDAFIVDAVD